MTNNKEAKQVVIKDKKLECSHCNDDKFWTRETLMNTPGMTFLKLDWANKRAQNYICSSCGYVHWFMTK